MLNDSDLRAGLGAKAGELAEAERGATVRAVAEIAGQYWGALPVFRPPAPVIAVLWPLSRLWLAGGWLKRSLSRSERLQTPVISVGGLTTGGTGKTPFVLWLAERLKARGMQPANPDARLPEAARPRGIPFWGLGKSRTSREPAMRPRAI